MFRAKLLSVEASFNYIEPGDTLYITTRWQNIGDEPLDKRASIAADIRFAHIQRKSEERPEDFRFTWEPYPSVLDWQPGEIVTTTGAWTVPAMWGGTYTVCLSMVGSDDEALRFVDGKNTVFSVRTLNIHIGWGWGRASLLRLRHPLIHNIAESIPGVEEKTPSAFYWNGLLLDEKLPIICGRETVEWRRFQPLIRERRIQDNTVIESVPQSVSMQKDSDSILYRLKGFYSTFAVLFKQEHTGFSVRVTDMELMTGCELLSVELPGLLQSTEPDATLISPYGGGRIISLANARTQSAVFYYDTCHFLAIGSQNRFFCADAADEPDAVLRQAVIADPSSTLRAVIGAELRLHIPAEKAGLRSIPVKHKGLMVHQLPKGDWKTAATIIRNRWSAEQGPSTYANTLIYKMLVDASAEFNPANPLTFGHKRLTTLKEAEEMAARMSAMTDGMKQIVYLVGWQKGGHDFSYPEPYKFGFNPRLGTTEEFLAAAGRLRKQNVLLSLHDNFDDAYPSEDVSASPDILALNAYGEPYCGWLWSGGMAYTVEPKKYVTSGKAAERIEQTVNRFGIHTSYHLDVLSSENRRYDFDQAALTDARENLEYKKEIVRQFNRRGIDVTSETLAEPFIGVIGAAHSTRYNFVRHLFDGDQFVPLTTLAFHGAMTYGMTPGNDVELLQAIAVGASQFGEIRRDGSDTEYFYLLALPMLCLAYKKAIDACWNGEAARVVYEDDSSVQVDFAEKTYRIQCEGQLIGEDFTSFVSQKNKYLFYARNAGEYVRHIPDNWQTVSVIPLTENGRGEPICADIQHGLLTIHAAAGQPYVIERLR